MKITTAQLRRLIREEVANSGAGLLFEGETEDREKEAFVSALNELSVAFKKVSAAYSDSGMRMLFKKKHDENLNKISNSINEIRNESVGELGEKLRDKIKYI